jgi:hypothetical protein
MLAYGDFIGGAASCRTGKKIKERVAATGRLEDSEVEKLRQILYADVKINRQG